MRSRNRKTIVSICRFRSARVWLTSVVLGVALTGCGGGGDSTGNPDETGPIIVGTGITDRTLARNILDVKAESGEKSTTPIASNGAFNGKVEGTGPFLSRIDLGNGESLYGIGYPDADGRVQQNVHSYSDLIIRNWYSSMGRNIDNDFDSSAAITLPTQAEIDAITERIVEIVALVMEDYSVGGADLLGGAATSNVNNFIIQNPVVINNNNFTIVVREDDDDGTQSLAADNLDLGTDLGVADTEAPTAPTDVRAIGASESDVVIVWTPSTDNVGVASYRVFREGVDIGETPYPVFTDNAGSAVATPLYTVVAVDSSGNVSASSAEVAGMALGTPDTTPPPAPTSVSLSPSIDSMEISWQQSAIDDVAGFQVLGAEEGMPVVQLATVTSTFMLDTTVASGTSYCYQVVAVDASNNASDPTAIQCQTTGGSVVETETTTPPTGGTTVEVAFAAAAYSVTENSTSAELKVQRVGASTTPISVNYAVTSGTAVDGEDFTATSGTLQWAAGDTQDKIISVQIASDADSTEGNETFMVTLSDVSSNASLGSVSVATVTIADAEAKVCDTVLETTAINEDTTLNLSCYLVNTTIDVREPAKLTIAPGTTLKFAAGRELRVREGASLSAIGTASQPVEFTGQDPTPGFWNGVYFYFSNSSSNNLSHAVVEYGGGSSQASNLYVQSSRVAVSNVTLRHSEEYGFTFDAQSTVTAFDNVTSTSNDVAGRTAPVQAGAIDGSGSFTGNENDVVEVTSSNLDEDVTWADLGVPWLADGMDVRAKWTVAEGTTVEFESGTELRVREEGQMVVSGSAENPVLFSGKEKSAGSWDGIYLYFATGAVSSMEHLTVEYGGAGPGAANLYSLGESRFSAENVVFRDSSGYGFNILPGAEMQKFDGITSEGNETSGKIGVNIVGEIGDDISLTGNTVDRLVIDSDVLLETQTWPKIDVPYYHEGLDIRAGLTIAAGNTLIAGVNSEIRVRQDGSIRAQGTLDEQIIFTAEEQLKGYWRGIYYYFGNSTNNILDYVVVEYGGLGDTGGNITSLCGSSAVPTATISNTNLDNGGAYGLYSASSCNFILGENISFMGNVSGPSNVEIP